MPLLNSGWHKYLQWLQLLWRGHGRGNTLVGRPMDVLHLKTPF